MHQSKPTLSPLIQPVGGAPEYHVLWHLNQLCNFRCDYCTRIGVDAYRAEEHPECGKYRPQHIADSFDGTGKVWRLHLTGGEPFLYPDFVALAGGLTKNHYLSMNTNLSTDNAYDFAEAILPSKVHSVHANLHLTERQKREKGMDMFLERFLFLQDKGFDIRLVYITYPSLFSRLLKDREYFLACGVKTFYLKVFRGVYGDKPYPRAYTREEKTLIKHYAVSRYELEILENKVHFYKKLCRAGQKAFHMDISGNLTRCNTINKAYGNLFTGRYRFDEFARPCPVLVCDCPYQGMKFSLKDNALGALKNRLEASSIMMTQRIIKAAQNRWGQPPYYI